MSSFKYPSVGSGGGVNIYANFASLPASSTTGDLAVTANTGNLYEWNGTAWVIIGSPGVLNSIGTIDSQTPSLNGAVSSGNTLYMQSASATRPGLVNNTTQSFSGNKTFTGSISASNLSGTNTGDVTLTAVGAAPNANGASLSGQALTLEPADATHPGVLTAADWNTFNNKQPAGNYITALTGDVTASGPGSVASSVAKIQGTAVSGTTGSGNVVFSTSPSLTTPNIGAASGSSLQLSGQLTSTVSTGTPPFVVASTTQVANLSVATAGFATSAGSATTATTATDADNIQTTQVSTNASFYPLFVSSSSNSYQAVDLGTGLTFNPSTNTLSTTTFVGNLTGTASGNVTSVTFTGDGTVLSSTPSSPVTSSGTVTASLNTQSANTVLAGPTSGGAATPTFRALVPADLPSGAFAPPTQQIFTSGSGTYTTPTSPRTPIYIRVRMVGGGGGGGGSGSAGGASGGDGGDTTFDTLTAGGGQGGSFQNASGAIGGTATLGAGYAGIALNGGNGAFGSGCTGSSIASGASGTSSPLGGAGAGGYAATNGANAIDNTGSGAGGGGGTANSGVVSGGGGAAGAWLDVYSTGALAATYAYAVGAGGAVGTGGTNGFDGGLGPKGIIIVDEYYQ